MYWKNCRSFWNVQIWSKNSDFERENSTLQYCPHFIIAHTSLLPTLQFCPHFNIAHTSILPTLHYCLARNTTPYITSKSQYYALNPPSSYSACHWNERRTAPIGYHSRLVTIRPLTSLLLVWRRRMYPEQKYLRLEASQEYRSKWVYDRKRWKKSSQIDKF